LFILQLQLNLVDLQFLNEPLRVMRGPLSFGVRPLTILIFA
jgi:hypothetical protein